jgi:hypothetical protein
VHVDSDETVRGKVDLLDHLQRENYEKALEVVQRLLDADAASGRRGKDLVLEQYRIHLEGIVKMNAADSSSSSEDEEEEEKGGDDSDSDDDDHSSSSSSSSEEEVEEEHEEQLREDDDEGEKKTSDDVDPMDSWRTAVARENGEKDESGADMIDYDGPMKREQREKFNELSERLDGLQMQNKEGGGGGERGSHK